MGSTRARAVEAGSPSFSSTLTSTPAATVESTLVTAR